MNDMTTVSEPTAGREQADEPRLYHLHGDAVDDHLPYRWSEPESGWCCRVCDLVGDASHFKAHTRREHVRAFRSSLRTFARLAARRSVQRGGHSDDNLIERALLGECERTRVGTAEDEAPRPRLRDAIAAAEARVA
jgi:hypothetical protein